MNVIGISETLKVGTYSLVVLFLMSLFSIEEADAAKRKKGGGRGVRRGAAGKVSARKKKGGGRKKAGGRKRGGGRGRGQARGGNNDAPGLAANNAGNNNNNINPNSLNLIGLNTDRLGLGLQNGLINRFGFDGQGRFVEFNPGAVQDGKIVNGDQAVRQVVQLGPNGQILTGQNGAFFDAAALEQAKMINRGDVNLNQMVRVNSDGEQAATLRPRAE